MKKIFLIIWIFLLNFWNSNALIIWVEEIPDCTEENWTCSAVCWWIRQQIWEYCTEWVQKSWSCSDACISTSSSSSWGWGWWWSISYEVCKDEDLLCTKVLDKYKFYRIKWRNCIWWNSWKECTEEKFLEDNPEEISDIQKKILEARKNSSENFSWKIKFSDVKNHWAKNFIEELTQKNIFQNSENFRPNDNLTRAELSKILVEWFWIGFPPSREWQGGEQKIFSDIQTISGKNIWYENYIKILSSNEILNWYSDWTVKPWNFVNRAEAMKMILKILEKTWKISDLKSEQNYFWDVENWSWYFDYVNKWKELWLISWYSDWTFWAWKNITRAEISKIIFRSLEF